MTNEGYQPRAPKSSPISPKGESHPTPPPPPPRLYNGAGVRVDRPPTTEWHGRKHQTMTMEPMSVFAFLAFMFCFFCLGVAFGGYICGN